ncbi:aquaporin [Hymenobacter sp. J193]|uniref:MIP/aquaporin family protein n=1 Tax=Hymenobacter sp. J193 TaxID=2898429 RepID=UPI002151D2A5|nr:aquaporin [Hymenobacter sp. J193]MCR5888382.1 aquaporin [Hymenobacter sp. J193]
MPFAAHLRVAFRRHWPYYLAEAAGLAFFVLCAGLLTVLLEHPASPLAPWLPMQPVARRALMGLGMALVIVSIVYSPWGKRSGAHINPAVTLAFWQLGKLRTPDAVWYVLAQLAGAVGAAQLLRGSLGRWYAHPAVNFTVTEPGPQGPLVAFWAEFGISFLLMIVLLVALHSGRLKRWTGVVLGLLLAVYIVFETPYSGMSLNPARSLGTALAAGSYQGLWLYWVAPPLATWLATVLFRYLHHGEDLECAVLAGCGPGPASPHTAGEEPPHYPTQQPE